MAPETRFVRTHADLQKFLDEIAYLSRSELPVGEYLGRFLQLTLAALGCQGGAIWLTQGADFQRASSLRFNETEYDSDEVQRKSIQNALRDCAQNRRPVVVGPSPSDADATPQDPKPNAIINHTPYPFFYVPVLVEVSGTMAVLGVLLVWAPPNVDPKSYKDFVGFLQAAAKQMAVFLRARRIESLAASTEKLQQLLRLVTELTGQLDRTMLAGAVVNWAREITGCDRCAMFGCRPDGRLEALAVSNVEVVDQKSALVQSQCRLAEDALLADQSSLYLKSSPRTEALGDISDYFFHSQANEAMAIPLLGRDGKKVGALLLENHKTQQFDEAKRDLSTALAMPAGRALGAAQDVASIPLAGTLRRWQRTLQSLRAEPRKFLLLKVAVPLAVVLAVALLPWRFTVGGDCSLMPLTRGIAVAETSGRIVEVLVNEGDKVSRGQPLARLDDAEVRQSLQVTEQEKARFETEANRLEVLGDDGGRRVAQIQAAEAERQIQLLQRRLANAQITIPIDGVVLTKDLRSRVGEMLPMGGRLCDVGDLQRWAVDVRVGEAEVALLESRLHRGKSLPLTLVLHSLPDQKLTATVRDGNAISQLSYPSAQARANAFLVRADLEVSPDLRSALKVGYTGRAKIPIGWRPLGYLATRKFLNYLRVRWLF
jgi:hypothetical protein